MNFFEIFKNTFFTEHLRATASDVLLLLLIELEESMMFHLLMPKSHIELLVKNLMRIVLFFSFPEMLL